MENAFTDHVWAITNCCKARHSDPEFQRNARTGAEADAAALERSREAEMGNALRAAGIPRRFWEHLRAPEDTEALRAARALEAARPECTFLTLVGPRGRGKSFAACWFVAKHGGLYIPNAQDLVTAGAFASVWHRMEAAPVLAIDELGAEYLNEAYASSLYACLNRRYSEQRRTVIVSNLDADGLKRRLLDCRLERLLDRFVTGGMFESVPGQSMRVHWSIGGGTQRAA